MYIKTIHYVLCVVYEKHPRRLTHRSSPDLAAERGTAPQDLEASGSQLSVVESYQGPKSM